MPAHHIALYLQIAGNQASDDAEIHGEERARQSMSPAHGLSASHHEPGGYEIRVMGHLDDRWTDWFDGLTITVEDNGDTRLTGPVVDQAALHGLLKKVRDLGMPLVSVTRVEPEQPHSLDTDARHNRADKETDR
jgi:hypothetical protein